jgi:hypothetical protein
MADNDFKALSDDALGERFRSLIGAYDKACMAYEHAKASEIHREFYAIEDELRSRRGDDWRRTGLEDKSLEDVVERFKECAVAQAGLDAMFPARAQRAGRLEAHSVEQLIQRLLDLAL